MNTPDPLSAIKKILSITERSRIISNRLQRILDIGYEALGHTPIQRKQEILKLKHEAHLRTHVDEKTDNRIDMTVECSLSYKTAIHNALNVENGELFKKALNWPNETYVIDEIDLVKIKYKRVSDDPTDGHYSIVVSDKTQFQMVQIFDRRSRMLNTLEKLTKMKAIEPTNLTDMGFK